MSLVIPYASSGQELGETRQAMTQKLMKDLEDVINKYKDKTEKYYVIVHAKSHPKATNIIKIKIIPMNLRPPMMLSCILFGVENSSGKLTLEWCLPGSWPTWSVGGTQEPVPETIASINELGKLTNLNIDGLIPY